MTPWWRKFAGIGCVIIALGVAIGLVVAVAESPARGNKFLEALRIVISWPFVAGVVAFAFGITFKRELSQFIHNIGFIRFPGGAEIHTSQAPPETSKAAPSGSTAGGPGALTLTPEDQEILRKHIEGLTKQMTDAHQEKDQILDSAIQIISEKQKEVVYWWFQYLSLFFVPATKVVLHWFGAQPIPLTKEFYEEAWKPIITDPTQRETILMVLLHHHLVEQKGMLLEITQAGRDFVAFLDAGAVAPSQH
jgi:hypothetical protein